MNYTYEIHHRRWIDTPKDYVKVGSCETLAQARDLRAVSGDLVVYAATHTIVPSEEWLWDWERRDTSSYAAQAIRSGK